MIRRRHHSDQQRVPRNSSTKHTPVEKPQHNTVSHTCLLPLIPPSSLAGSLGVYSDQNPARLLYLFPVRPSYQVPTYVVRITKTGNFVPACSIQPEVPQSMFTSFFVVLSSVASSFPSPRNNTYYLPSSPPRASKRIQVETKTTSLQGKPAACCNVDR